MNKQLIITFILLFGLNHLKSQEWHTNIDEAKTLASEESKTILLVFQGSDWCAPCIKLEKEIWESEVFHEFASQNLVLLQADFPRRKKNSLSKELQDHNSKLAEKYNDSGVFPFVVLLNKEGEVFGETGYKQMDATEYVDHLNEMIKL